jgi:hypothetical protein
MKTELHLKSVSGLTSESFTDRTSDDHSNSYASGSIDSFIYHEMSDVPVSSQSDISRLQDNAMVLRDLNDRLSFLSKEIKYLLNLK